MFAEPRADDMRAVTSTERNPTSSDALAALATRCSKPPTLVPGAGAVEGFTVCAPGGRRLLRSFAARRPTPVWLGRGAMLPDLPTEAAACGTARRN